MEQIGSQRLAELVSERMAATEISNGKETIDTSSDDSGVENQASTTTADEELVDLMKKLEGRKEETLVLATAGASGVGKSKLINNFLGLKGKKVAESGHSVRSVTKDVDVYEEVVHGTRVSIIDTPGFESWDLSSKDEAEALAALSVQFEGKADILLYCINVSSRFDAKEEYIVKKLTKAFGKKIWQHAILVLTHADRILEEESEKKLESLVEDFTKEFHKVLAKADVDVCVSPVWESSEVNINGGIVGIPVGNRDCPENWKCLLLKEVIKKCDIDAIPAILKIQGIAPLWVARALGGVLGAADAAAGGGTIGGIFGCVIGASIGAAVGAGVGTLPGAVTGAAVGFWIGAASGAGVVGVPSAIVGGIDGGKHPSEFVQELTGLAMIIKARHLVEEKKKAKT